MCFNPANETNQLVPERKIPRCFVLGFSVHPTVGLEGQRAKAPIRAVAIIPARYASTRLPAKALADICGRPMIEHVYRQASAAASVESVLVATDDERIARAVTSFGGRYRMTRVDHRSGTDRLAEVAHTVRSDLIVNIQVDEPLIQPGMIDAAVAACSNDPTVRMSTLRCPIRSAAALHDPDIVKVAVDRNDYALFFSRGSIGLHRTSEPENWAVDKHIGVYVYQRSFLLTLSQLEPTPLERSEKLEQLRVLEHGYRIMTTKTEHDSIGVDTPADLNVVRQLVATEANS